MQSAQTLQSEAASILPAPSKESTASRWRAIREEVGPATEATAHPAESTVAECRIEHLPVSKLKEHAVAADVPPVKAEQMSEMVAEAEGTGIIGPRPLVVLPDRTTVIFGFHELVVARAAKLAFVPCVVADEPDPKAYALRNTLLIPQLTDDQRAVVALKLKEHLSKVLKSERGKTAAAAKKEANLSAQRTDKSKGKRDARKETAKNLNVSERKLRALSAIAAHEEENPPKGDGSAFERISTGESTIASELKVVTQAEEAAQQAEKEKALASLPVLDDWLLGEPLNLLRDRLGEREVDLLLLDNAEMGEDSLKRLLDVLSPSLSTGASIVCLAKFEDEPMLRSTLRAASYAVSRPLIIDLAEAAAGAILGQRHLTVLRALSGKQPALPKLFTSDIIREPRVNGRAYSVKLIIESFCQPNGLVVSPFASDESGYVAGKRAGRSVLAVAASDVVFAAGRKRIDEALASPTPVRAVAEEGAK